MKVAAVSWAIRPTDSVNEFFDHLIRLLKACEGANLVVLPELTSLELLGTRSNMETKDEPAFLADLLEPRIAEFGQLAAYFACTLIGGTHFIRTNTGIINSAVAGFPDGSYTVDLPKNLLTQFEATEWQIKSGSGLRQLPDSRIGVTVCYDSEFPESGRAIAESGVLVQCVPAFTESITGFQRVRWSCKARAIENQLFVVHSSLVGSLGREPVPTTYGSSAIMTPSMEPFPQSASLAETAPNKEGVAIADLDFQLLDQVRTTGDVRNWKDRDKADWSLNRAACFESTKS